MDLTVLKYGYSQSILSKIIVKMKILLLGATGRTGELVLKKALEAGFKVNCLARKTERITKRENLRIFEGDPSNKYHLSNALSDCNYIISVLNISRKSDFPWSKLKTPEHYLSDVMQTILQVTKDKAIKHLTICSAWGVAETKKDLPKWFKWLIDKSNIGVAYKDHERQESLLEKANLSWTIVRPVGLTNTKKKENITESYQNYPKPGLLISRLSVAEYLLASLLNKNLKNKKVVVSKK